MATVVSAIIEPDVEVIKSHLETLFGVAREDYPGGLIELRFGATKLDRFAYFGMAPERIAEAAEFAANRNKEGCNIYVGVNPRKPSTNTRYAGDTGDVEIAFWQFADIDDAEAVVHAVERAASLKPTMTVTTGTVPHKRPHLYWQLEEPVRNLGPWTERQRGIAQQFQGDSVIDPPRIMRLAGSINFPPPHKLQRGYRVERVTMRTEFAEERAPVAPEQVAAAYPYVPERQDPNTAQPAKGQTTLSAMAHKSFDVAGRIQKARNDDKWRENVRALTAHWAGIGWSNVEILAMADHLTLAGYSVEETRKDMLRLTEDARSKWNFPDPDPVDIPDDEEREKAAELIVVDAFDFVEADIPVRPWLVPGALLAGYTHMLAAPGGSGKSLFTLQFAIALASGTQWGEFVPRKRYRSLIVNTEDDINEQRRRLAAAARVMRIDPASLRGWIYLVDASDGIVIAGHDPAKRTLVITPVTAKLNAFIEENQIDVLWADPFAETFEGDENDNSEVKWAMRIWRDEVARKTSTAVYLVHHTTKYSNGGAGDANIIRGAGAIVNSTRISVTLMPMTADEATVIGVEQGERHLYVRYDDAKVNQSLKTNTGKWFKKVSVELANGKGLEQPDEVGALEPWTPPDAFDGLTLASIGMVLDRVEEGLVDRDGTVTGVRYAASTKGGTKESGRWLGNLLMDALEMKEAHAKTVIKTWLKSGVLVEDEYHNPVRRDREKGLYAPRDKRPGVQS